ncbi:hypothetical protein [Caldimonas tepidiphila]|uniref:hypothetical protein n=1 Tax=Caldimonas tepidiphila TaxID=2315841 RepID=UPI000E5B4DDE|nr:hypothetical protein [Caldimonas tepidiphila]
MSPASPPRDRPRKPAPAARPRPSTDLARFEPLSPMARRQIDELIARGAQVLEVSATHVMLQRDGHKARIDAMGRVEWLVQATPARQPPPPPRRGGRKP